MILSQNEQSIIKLLRDAKAHSKILIQKKTANDAVEYRVEVQESILLKKKENPVDGLL